MAEETTPKYPDIHIKIRLMPNAFEILGQVRREMRHAGIDNEYGAFIEEATSGGYDQLLATVRKWFGVDER